MLKFCRAKEFLKEIQITTSFHVTQLILDNESEEAKEFLKTFKTEVDECRSSSTFTLTQTTQSSEGTEDTSTNLKISSIKNLLTETEVQSYSDFKRLLRHCDVCSLGQRVQGYDGYACFKNERDYDQVVKDEMDGWNGFEFSDLNIEHIGSNKEGRKTGDKGKAKAVDDGLEDEEFGQFLMDQGSTTKAKKKPRTRMV
ncbi:unnamed protein product [Cuscuta campestris]|uniref:Uncharacterized protein n=1 Tax=Cuscuta campestris TaxID=132261 RepID=A0A484KZ93_9ASTE|nr:unnamed protein product [Cuscuta campestris]